VEVRNGSGSLFAGFSGGAVTRQGSQVGEHRRGGSIGVGLYLRRARRVIAGARQAEPDLERRVALLRERGRTSIRWPLVVGALLVAVATLATFADAAE
jgi:hypothetical protein